MMTTLGIRWPPGTSLLCPRNNCHYHTKPIGEAARVTRTLNKLFASELFILHASVIYTDVN